VTTRRWKLDFHRWFATDAALDVPIVRANDVAPEDRRYFGRPSTQPTNLPKEPITASCTIDEHIDHLAIDFTTTCPGEPHWIAVSYSPNWRVEGAERIYLASPAFMLVFPTDSHVRLTYRNIAVDWLGILASLTGIGLCLAVAGRVPSAAARDRIDAVLATMRPVLMPAAVILFTLVTAWNIARDLGPSRLYQRGWDAFSKGDYPTAIHNFDWARLLGGESNTAGDATFFRAASLLRSNRPVDAMAGYQSVIDDFPGAIWIAESHYHIGLCQRQLAHWRAARDKFRFVISTYPGDRWAGFAKEQLDQLRQESRARGHRHG